jgi:hypothetical protein
LDNEDYITHIRKEISEKNVHENARGGKKMKMKIAAVLTAVMLIAVPSAFARPHCGYRSWGGPPPGRCYYGGYYYGCGPRYSLAGDIVRLVDASVGLTLGVLGAPRYVVSTPVVYCPAQPAAVVTPAPPVTPAPRPAAVTVYPAPAPVVYYQPAPAVVPAGYTVQYARPVYVRGWGY